jgi:hypothetical protein
MRPQCPRTPDLGMCHKLVFLQGPDGWPIDNAKEGIQQVTQVRALMASAAGVVLSVAFYNYFGVSVTKKLSAAARLSIDSCRTAVVWAISVIAGWEDFATMQLFGFFILICGSTLYNEVLATLVDYERCASWQASRLSGLHHASLLSRRLRLPAVHGL